MGKKKDVKICRMQTWAQMKGCGILFPGCMPMCNRRLVTFERTINKQGRCYHRIFGSCHSAKNNWKLGVLLYVKGKPLNSASLWGWQFVVYLVISEVTANCWLVNYIQLLQLFPTTYLLKSILLKQEGKSLTFCCSSILLNAFFSFQIFATEGTKLASALHALSDQVMYLMTSVILLRRCLCCILP